MARNRGARKGQNREDVAKTQRNRWFADSPPEGSGFEPLVPSPCAPETLSWRRDRGVQTERGFAGTRKATRPSRANVAPSQLGCVSNPVAEVASPGR
jgi:hypothetical protein